VADKAHLTRLSASRGSLPKILILPRCAEENPAMARSSVVLPAPLRRSMRDTYPRRLRADVAQGRVVAVILPDTLTATALIALLRRDGP